MKKEIRFWPAPHGGVILQFVGKTGAISIDNDFIDKEKYHRVTSPRDIPEAFIKIIKQRWDKLHYPGKAGTGSAGLSKLCDVARDGFGMYACYGRFDWYIEEYECVKNAVEEAEWEKRRDVNIHEVI